MAIFRSTPEWCSATVIWFVRADVVTSEQYFHHSLVPIPGSTQEWCSATVIWFVRGNVVPSEEYIYDSLVSISRSTPERCSAIVVRPIGIDDVLLE